MPESSAPFELRGRRLVLSRFDYGDAPDLLALDDDPRVRRYLVDDPVETPTQALVLIDYLKSLYDDGRGLGIWHAADEHGAFLGHFSLMPVTPADRPEVEIGVRLGPAAWGKFYALEGGRILCRYAFEELGLTRLVGFCDPQNRVVEILLRRLGFKQTGLQMHNERQVLGFALKAPQPKTPEDQDHPNPAHQISPAAAGPTRE